jgi:hypothetical protein
MDQETECAPNADSTLIVTDILTTISRPLLKAYYHVTAYIPRRLPRSLEDFMALKEILMKGYGLEDRPDVWFTVCGQMTSTSATSIRKPYAHYVNAAKRLETNRLARDGKIYFNKLNEDKIKELTENIVASPSPESIQPTEP